MARVVEHLSVAELEARFEACEDVTSSRRFQTIWLLAKGHSTGEVAEMTSFGQRWLEQLLERYNALGPAALGDLRRDNGREATVLNPDLLERLRVRLEEPPPDGGRWTCAKVALWMAGELGLTKARSAARLGGPASHRMVDPEATAAEPEGCDARRARGFFVTAQLRGAI